MSYIIADNVHAIILYALLQKSPKLDIYLVAHMKFCTEAELDQSSEQAMISDLPTKGFLF